MEEQGNKVRCPECNRKVPEGKFCDRCGADITDAPAVEDEPTAQRSSFAGGSTIVSSDSGAAAGVTQRIKADYPEAAGVAGVVFGDAASPVDAVGTDEETLPQSAPKPVLDRFSEHTTALSSLADDIGSECEDLVLSVDVGRLFVGGVQSPFKLHIRCLEKLRDLNVEVRMEDLRSNRIQRSQKNWASPSKGKRGRDFSFGFLPPVEMVGNVTFEIGIRYTKESDGRYYEFNAESDHVVYGGDQEPSQVAESLVINITNNLSGHAADHNIQQNVADFYRQGAKRTTTMSQFADLVRNAPAAWCPAPLYEVSRGFASTLPVTAVPDKAKVSKLTLKIDGVRIHLLHGDDIQFGRWRDKEGGPSNDIVTRLFGREGIDREFIRRVNGKISRCHAMFRREGDDCFVRNEARLLHKDGRLDSPNTIYVDGREVPRHDQVKLELKQVTTITLASSLTDNERVFGWTAQLLACELCNTSDCPMPGTCHTNTPSALILQRLDDVPEVFVVLWHYFPMRELDPRLNKLRLRRYKDAFCYRAGGEVGWLVPGITVPLPNGTKVQVEEYSQVNLS